MIRLSTQNHNLAELKSLARTHQHQSIVMAAQIHKLEVKVAMKSPEKLVSFFRNHVLEMPKLAPAIVKSCEIIGGGTQMGPGSRLSATYSIRKHYNWTVIISGFFNNCLLN